MPRTNAGPEWMPPASLVDELAYADDAFVRETVVGMPAQQANIVLQAVKARRLGVERADAAASEQADVQTWQSALGVNRFGDREAPTDLQMLINQIEDPRQLRTVLDSITETGRAPPSMLGQTGNLGDFGVPKGTKFSVREKPDGSGVDVVYQLPGESEWNQYDPPGLSGSNVLAFLRSQLTIGNVASVGADAALASRLGPAGRAGMSAASAGAGRALDEMMEPGQQSTSDVTGEAVESAQFGAAGSVLGDALNATGNALKGRGFLVNPRTGLDPNAMRAQVTAGRRGWDLLSLGELGYAVPKSAESIAAQTGRRERARRTKRGVQLLESLTSGAGDQNILKVPIEELQRARDAALDGARQELGVGIRELESRGALRTTTPEKFGRRAYDSIGAVVRADKEIGRRYFDAAIKQAQDDGVVFNVEPFLGAVREFRELVPLRGIPEEELGFPDPQVRITPARREIVGVSPDTPAVDGDVVLRQGPATQIPAQQELVGTGTVETAPGQPNFGEPAMRTVPARTVPGEQEAVALAADQPARAGDVVTRDIPGRQSIESFAIPIGERETIAEWAQGYRREFRQLFGIVDRLNPQQPAEFLEGIRRIQSWLGALSDPKPGLIVDPESIRVASILSQKLDESIRSSPGTEGFNAALDHAKAYWQNMLQFQRTMDLFKPTGDRTASYGERVYRAFAGDDKELLTEQGALAALRVLRNRPKGVEEFRGALATDALRNPDRLPTLLQNIDIARRQPNGMAIFDDSLRNQLEAYQARLANADYGQLNRQIDAFQNEALTAQKIIEGGSRNIEYVRTMLRQGIWTQDELRGYILSDLATKSMKTAGERGYAVLSPSAYQAELKRVRDSGIFDLLDGRSRELLQDVELMTTFMNDTESIAAGAMSSGALNAGRATNLPFSPFALVKEVRARYTAMRAWLGSNPSMLRLRGFGDVPPNNWRVTREVVRLATESLARSTPRPSISPTEPSQEPQPQAQVSQ